MSRSFDSEPDAFRAMHTDSSDTNASQNNLLQHLDTLITARLSDFETRFSEQQKEMSSVHLAKIEGLTAKSAYQFKRKGNEQQYKHSVDVCEKLQAANTALSSQPVSSSSLECARTKISEEEEERKKLLITKENVDIGHHSYVEACQLLETAPIRKVKEQLKETEICLQHVGLNTKDVIALTYALLNNNRVESLDLEDNRLTHEAILHVVEVLRHNITLSSLSLSDNKFSPNCALVLADAITNSTWLTHLSLSGMSSFCSFPEQQNNVSLVWLNLSNNAIGETGAKFIGKALTINDTVEVLDLSWNHVRRMGAVTICKGLQTNSSLANLNLAWNGFAYEGGIALEEVLKQNLALKVLDISNNRINWEGVVHISRGLRGNSVLQILKQIGCNPIAMEGVQKLLQAIHTTRSSVIHISFESVKRIPLTLLVRYIGMMGIRIMDLFRMFDADNHALVTKANFIRGLKKIGAPISEQDMRMVARRLDKRGEGTISYSILANGVRNHMREERKEDRRQEILEMKRREHRKALLNMGYNEIKPVYFTEVNMFTSSASRNFSRLLLSSASSFSSKHESVNGKEPLRLPPLAQESNRAKSASQPNMY
ncbi:hypothetical protein FSP39_003093 [Pinctada imbricata]|uniref:EF-hand domain-containing protein n=1 Tax=Pinctada imbricata TaxID=66713 RepID=A0AA88XV77_PINIB|nr:hypothetical protein FSP39_003093 [Pinctada imbricata]